MPMYKAVKIVLDELYDYRGILFVGVFVFGMRALLDPKSSGFDYICFA